MTQRFALSDAATELRIPGRVPFICECAEPPCTTIVRLSSAKCAEIRSQPTHFLNARGHQVAAQGGRVVEEHRGYVIVDKIGRAAEGVRDLDPRSEDRYDPWSTNGGVVDERELRIGQNEALFRHVNERLEDVNDAFGPMAGDFEIVCECADLDCAERIVILRDAYEKLRADPLLFAIVAGHVAAGVEEVIEQRKGYSVVRKHPGTPAALASASNPADR